MSAEPAHKSKGIASATTEPVPNIEVNQHGAGYAVVEQGHVIPSTGTRRVTMKWEYITYCLYAWGGTGVGIGNSGSSLQQNLVQTQFPSGFMKWGGQKTSTTSFLLDTSGITFALQLIVLLFLRPYADYGNWRPWLLIIWTVLGIATSLAFFGLLYPYQWAVASGVYVTANVCYSCTVAFYEAAFPALVRDLPQLIASEQALIDGTTTPKAHADLDTLERSKLSNVSSIYSSVGSAFSIILSIAIIKIVGVATTEENTKVYSDITGYFGLIWIVSSVPWSIFLHFIRTVDLPEYSPRASLGMSLRTRMLSVQHSRLLFLLEQHRPGQSLPDCTSWYVVGPKQIWEAMRNISQLKQTFLYLIGNFLVVDCYTTSGTIANFLQNDAIDFSAITYCWLFVLVYGLTVPCYLANMYIQKRFNIHPKWMFVFAGICTCLPNLWGVIGIWTDKIGYHHVWEFWAWIGLTTAGLGSYGQTLMAEVSPQPKMFIFFALYNTIGQTAAFTGAIIDDAGGVQQQGFWFTLARGLIGCGLVALVDTEKAKINNAKYLEKERAGLYASYGDVDVKKDVGRSASLVEPTLGIELS